MLLIAGMSRLGLAADITRRITFKAKTISV